MRVALSGLTMAEYFRDVKHQDVLLFIDNIFRFTQAGSEVSALLGRMPSAVGYQPTLATEMGALQERITSTKEGSITSVQAVYVPADDLTDPFSTDSSYSFIFKSTDPETQALYAEYTELVAAAKAITDDMDARYSAFAKAEAFLLDHAFAVPFSISNRSYQMCNLNVFEGQYASFGLANQRYKDQHLYSSSMGMEEYQAAYAEWQSKKAG